MTDFTPKHAAVCALTLLVAAADTMTSSTRPPSNLSYRAVTTVGAYASTLGSRGSATHAIPFSRGREYYLGATCGDGCDVDLELQSPLGRPIDRHLGPGTAEVAVIPAASGSYKALVTMQRCDAGTCAYTLIVRAR